MVVHFDLDAFYASVAQRDDPELRGKPVAIAWDSRRSVVLTASYEARPFGVRSAMPLYRALERCRDLVVVKPDFPKYKAASQAAFAIFAEGAKAVEGLSLDEAFVALEADAVEDAMAFARNVRARIRDEIGLTASAGIATGKIVAKIASDLCKPDGLRLVEAGTEAAFLAPLQVGRLWGIGPKAQTRLAAVGVETIGDFAALDDAQLFELFGRGGRELREMARGNDARAVVAGRETRSVSSEQTYEFDLRDDAAIRTALRELSAEVARRLREHGLHGSTIGIKVKHHDFSIVVRQTQVALPTDDPVIIEEAVMHCWERAASANIAVRLLGVRVADIVDEPPRQLSLLP